MPTHLFEAEIGGRKLSLEIGRFAYNANAAVKAQYGETVVLATAVMSSSPKGGIDYLPLSVEFDEKLYAAGRIKGSRWVKREGRPTDEAILTNRLIDRTIRPLFDSRVRHEIQIIVTNLSFDAENDPDVVAAIATSCALAVSDIPWSGPIGAVRIGKVNGEIVINPTYAERGESSVDLVVAGPREYVNMVEAGSHEVSEAEIIEAVERAQEVIRSLVDFQKDIQQKIGKEKAALLAPPDENIAEHFRGALGEKLANAFSGRVDMDKVNELKRATLAEIAQALPGNARVWDEAGQLFEEELGRLIKRNVLEKSERPDGRALDELRPLHIEVGLLPRTHGSGLFERGNTQALSVLTLGPPGLEQSLETMEFVGKKRFMHHYNFPPFSSGETGRMMTGRREIGHGALAERALEPLLPSKDDFPYAIRIVTEILSSNGSTSMASVSGSSLALFDAGVPTRAAAAGISIGVVVEDENAPEKHYRLLTDIQGPEDHHGNMDFKIAGTAKGITALQMDVKMIGLTPQMMAEALEWAKRARLQILEAMKEVIASPRPELSSHAPRILMLKINPEKIGAVIGPGGKVINSIIEKHGVEIDIEDDGRIFITSLNGNGAGEKALEWIRSITREVEPGEIFTGRVSRLLNFGAFVEILPGKQGLIHVSELAPWHVERVGDIVKVGDEVKVRVKEIDSEGRINLTMKEFVKAPMPPKK